MTSFPPDAADSGRTADAQGQPGKALIVPRQVLPSRVLRDRPDLDRLKRQPKELLAAFVAGHAAAAGVHAHYRAADPATFALHDAQLAIARGHGFESWPKLKARVDGVTAARLCDAVERGEVRALHVALLRRDGAMVRRLMARGADAHLGICPNRDATSALTIAVERGYTVMTLLRDANG